MSEINYLTTVGPSAARGRLREIYDQIKEDFGIIPDPFILHSPIPDLLAGTWAVCRESLIAGRAPRHHTEAIATAVSEANDCPYCVDAHSTMLRAAGRGDIARALQRPHSLGASQSTDPALGSLAAWASASGSATSAVAHPPTFSPDLAPEYVGTAVAFHYINRLATVLLAPSPFPGPRVAHGLISRLAARRLADTVRREKRPGASLRFLSEQPPGGPRAWTDGSASIAAAFSALLAATNAAAELALDPEVRLRVQQRIDCWQGGPTAISRSWLESEVEGLSRTQADEARLVLLIALSPHQLDEGIVAAYKRRRSSDAELLGALTWASASAALRIGDWLGATPRRDAAHAGKARAPHTVPQS